MKKNIRISRVRNLYLTVVPFFDINRKLMHLLSHAKIKATMYVVSTLLGLLFGMNAYAGTGFVKGQVDLIRTHNARFDPDWAPPRAWFTLKGVSVAGACGKWYESVLFVVDDKQALSFVMTAQATNQEVAVYFNDAIIVNGWCVAGYVTIGGSVPLK